MDGPSLSLSTAAFAWFCVPETKGRTQEQMREHFKQQQETAGDEEPRQTDDSQHEKLGNTNHDEGGTVMVERNRNTGTCQQKKNAYNTTKSSFKKVHSLKKVFSDHLFRIFACVGKF